MLTWGDGVSNVDLDKLLAFHKSHGKLATLTAVRPPARFGHMVFDGDLVREFDREAPDRARGGSTAPSSCSSRRSSTTSRVTMTQFEREPMENLSPRRPARWPTATRGSGSAWIPSGTSVLLEDRCGSRAIRPGGRGSRSDANSGDGSSRLHRHDAHPHAPAMPGTRSWGWTRICIERCTYGDPSSIASVPRIEKDIREVMPEDLRGHRRRVMHLAALSNDPLGNLNPEVHVGHQPSRERSALAELARDAGVRRFVFSSSCSNYGAAGDDHARRVRPRSTRSRPTADPRSAWSRTSRRWRRTRSRPTHPAERHSLRRVAQAARSIW
jgi:hypothetical protein